MKPDIDVAGGWMAIPGWLDPNEGAALQHAVSSTAPDTAIVELGRWCGRSLIALAEARSEQQRRVGTAEAWAEAWAEKRFPSTQAAPLRPIYSYDIYPEASQAGDAAAGAETAATWGKITPGEAWHTSQAVVAAFRVQNCHLVPEDALDGAKRYTGPKVGLLYIDDDHTGERVVAEIEAWEPHMTAEAEVCIHDYYHEPYGIEVAVDRWLMTHPEWVAVESRLSMMRLRRRWKPEAPRAVAVPRKVFPETEVTESGRRPGGGHPEHQHPYVSVLYNTWRIGGLDCLKISLDRQKCPDGFFEVVIVDALYPYRRDAVAALFRDAPYRVKHVNPTGNPFPRDHGNLARNDAIRAAEGDVCVWWCDYSLAEARSLARHYAAVEASEFRASSCGHIVYGEISVEALHPAFRTALPIRTIDDYVDLVEGLPADSPLWTSIFRDDPRTLGRAKLILVQEGHGHPYEMRGRVSVSTAIPYGRDERRDWLNGPIAGFYYYAKNEATSRRALLAINGWEESFDDGHTCDDLDIGRRLSDEGFILDKGNEAFVPNPRPFFPLMRWKRPPVENRRLNDVLSAIGRPRAIRGIVNEMAAIPKPEVEHAVA